MDSKSSTAGTTHSKSAQASKARGQTPSKVASYHVWRVEYLGSPNHEAIFVETHQNGQKSGVLYHVVGTILQGMQYESRSAHAPELSASYAGQKQHLGVVSAANYNSINSICQGIQPPGAQVRLSGKPIDPSRPLYRCGDWVSDAIHALRHQGVLEQTVHSREGYGG